MANHKSALKRIRSSETRRLRNRYQLKTTRTYVKRLRETTDKAEAEKLLQGSNRDAGQAGQEKHHS